MKKKAKKNSGFSDVINNVTAGLKKYVPIYTKKMGKAAQDYGQIGLDNIDIQVYKNKIKKITTQIGEFVLNSSPQLNFSGNKKIQKMIKEIDKLQKKIKEKEKHKKIIQKKNKAQNKKKKTAGRRTSKKKKKTSSKRRSR